VEKVTAGKVGKVVKAKVLKCVLNGEIQELVLQAQIVLMPIRTMLVTRKHQAKAKAKARMKVQNHVLTMPRDHAN
jgi:hypothetical protein